MLCVTHKMRSSSRRHVCPNLASHWGRRQAAETAQLPISFRSHEVYWARQSLVHPGRPGAEIGTFAVGLGATAEPIPRVQPTPPASKKHCHAVVFAFSAWPALAIRSQLGGTIQPDSYSNRRVSVQLASCPAVICGPANRVDELGFGGCRPDHHPVTIAYLAAWTDLDIAPRLEKRT